MTLKKTIRRRICKPDYTNIQIRRSRTSHDVITIDPKEVKTLMMVLPYKIMVVTMF